MKLPTINPRPRFSVSETNVGYWIAQVHGIDDCQIPLGGYRKGEPEKWALIDIANGRTRESCIKKALKVFGIVGEYK